MIYLGTDHRGFELKEQIKEFLKEQGIAFEDLGNHQLDPNDDYTDIGFLVAKKIAEKPDENRGILLCGSGIGVVIAANRIKGVRAGLCLSTWMAEHGRQNEDIKIPIILITATMKESEYILRGFEAGADDYVTRPRDNCEIMARIRANLPPEVTDYNDDLRIDKVTRRVCVKRDGTWQEVHLMRLEFNLFDVLTMNAGRVVLSTTLKDQVWGKPVSDDVLAVYIRRLLKKLEPIPVEAVYIETINGIGFRFIGRSTRPSGMCPERREV